MMKFYLIILALFVLSCEKDDNSDNDLFCADNILLETFQATDILENSVNVYGKITNNCSQYDVISQGFVYGLNIFPKIDDNIIEIQGADASASIDEIDWGRTYYYRTFMTNETGTYYGNTMSFTTTFPERVNFIDENFEQALIDLGYDDFIDGFVLTENIVDVEELDVSNKDIRSYFGIEGFRALEKLNFSNNRLNSLNVSQNLNLIELECSGNPIRDLHTGKNINLQKITCIGGSIDSLELSNNTELRELYLSGQFLSIDVSKNLELRNLFINSNVLRSLDVTNNLELRDLTYYGWVEFEPVDLSKNIKLTSLRTGTYASSIDLSRNINLIEVDIGGSRITTLDLSNNPFLETVKCDYSLYLTHLNIANNNNLDLYVLLALSCPVLACIEVDDVDYAENNSEWRKDSTTNFATICN